jgi:hypothetical protein
MTVTLNEQVETFPAASRAVYVTTVKPFGKAEPTGWLGVNDANEQLSEAVGGVQLTV